MKTPEQIGREVIETNYGIGTEWEEPNAYGEQGFTRAQAETDIDADDIRRLIEQGIEADRAQRINDGSVHGAVISELEDRIASDKDDAEGYTYRRRAIDWINAEPDEFWEEFGAPLIDDVERKFILTEPDPA